MAKAIVLGTLGTLGIAGPLTVSTYVKNSQSIWDMVSKDALPNSASDEDWNLLKTNLSSKTEINDAELKKIKDGSSVSDQEGSLKNWCIKSYKKSYKGWFIKEKETLLKDVKDACILTIRKKLGETKSLNNESWDQSVFEKNISALKTYNDTKVSLTKELNDLKAELVKQGEEAKTKWEKLKEWCIKTYEQGYQGDNNKWKLVNKFCIKG